MKSVSSRNISFKKFGILPMFVIITPKEVYDTYVEIDKNLLLDVKTYNSLIQKSSSIIFLFFSVNICYHFLLCYRYIYNP